MLEIRREHEAAGDSSGKQLHHVARYTIPGHVPGPDKSYLDIITDDFSVYRFTRFEDHLPWCYEPGTRNPDDPRVPRTGRLPAVVEAIIESEAEDVETEWGNGVNY